MVLGAKGPEFGSQDSKIICLWAAIPANLTPIESAICRQRGGRVFGQPLAQAPRWLSTSNFPRSEEHTSELQSRLHLVCRLLLETKKHNDQPPQLRTLHYPDLRCIHPLRMHGSPAATTCQPHPAVRDLPRLDDAAPSRHYSLLAH